MSYTAKEVLQMLRVKHDATNFDAQRWVFFEELRVGTGFADQWDRYDWARSESGQWTKTRKDGYWPEQRIDAWAMSVWKSDGFKSVAYEVKVSRSDFMREIEQPLKRQTAMRFSNRFFFVAPDGIIKPDEVPDDCGLMTVKNDKIRITKQAVHRDIGQPSWEFYASLVRAIGRKGYEAMFSELAEAA